MSALLSDQKFIEIDGVRLKVHVDYDPENYQGCNGCGAGWNTHVVPDSIYFKSIKMACCPHDFRYERGGTLEDKHIADEEFLYNMIAIVEAYGNGRWYYPTSMARSRAMTYYSAVASLGDDVFLANNKKEESEDGSDVLKDSDVDRVVVQRGSCDRARNKRSRDDKYRVRRSESERGV